MDKLLISEVILLTLDILVTICIFIYEYIQWSHRNKEHKESEFEKQWNELQSLYPKQNSDGVMYMDTDSLMNQRELEIANSILKDFEIKEENEQYTMFFGELQNSPSYYTHRTLKKEQYNYIKELKKHENKSN